MLYDNCICGLINPLVISDYVRVVVSCVLFRTLFAVVLFDVVILVIASCILVAIEKVVSGHYKINTELEN